MENKTLKEKLNPLQAYMSPTPALAKKLGDSLLGVSTMVTASAIGADMDWLSYLSLFIGVVGKFMTNMFTTNTKK
tara:strand:- start:4172 stop:4396 length:225 start_codon:yes stop_codon:yes gene_type:complete